MMRNSMEDSESVHVRRERVGVCQREGVCESVIQSGSVTLTLFQRLELERDKSTFLNCCKTLRLV